MKKKILLLALTDCSLYESFEDNLRENGFEPTLVLNEKHPFKYRSIWQRLDNLWRKVLLGDRQYKNKLRERHNQEQYLKAIGPHAPYDYSLVIRSDFFSMDVLMAAKSCSKRFVAYHYDGMEENVLDRIGLFDDFFVFDKKDIEKHPDHKLKLAHNFYFDCYENAPPVSPVQGVYYRGSYESSRMGDLLKCDAYLVKNRVPAVLELFGHDEVIRERFSLAPETNIVIEQTVLPYKMYLEKMLSHGVILDLVVGRHGGFSFRIFEGLYYRKKIITTNLNVPEMDFYHENNFFVVRDRNYEGLLEFMEKPYVDLDPKIVEKYGFTNWINTLLDIKT